jgi:hypothetical protein
MNDESEVSRASAQSALSSDGTFAITRSNYSDNRDKGDFGTRYPGSVWIQISWKRFTFLR